MSGYLKHIYIWNTIDKVRNPGFERGVDFVNGGVCVCVGGEIIKSDEGHISIQIML